MFNWFKRNKQEEAEITPADAPAMPPELSDYYQTERRERMWATWLLSFVALSVTVIILFAVFLGGRWVYRRYVKKPETPRTPTIAINQQDNKPNNSGSTNKSSQPAVNVNPPSGQTNSSQSSNNSGSSSTSSSSTQSSGSSNPAVAGSGKNMPDTGPGDTAAVFFISTGLGTLAYRLINRKRS